VAATATAHTLMPPHVQSVIAIPHEIEVSSESIFMQRAAISLQQDGGYLIGSNMSADVNMWSMFRMLRYAQFEHAHGTMIAVWPLGRPSIFNCFSRRTMPQSTLSTCFNISMREVLLREYVQGVQSIGTMIPSGWVSSVSIESVWINSRCSQVHARKNR